MEFMIEAYKLSKNYGKNMAVCDISFSVQKGEIFGFLGHNGAGKTTTIRMLTGQIYPTSGFCNIAGYDSTKEQELIKPIIGVVSDTQNLYERMTGKENLILFADLYGIKKNRVQEILALIQLQHRSKEKVETYSNGMKQRLLIARALLHKPEAIFLDEPTRGLDPTSAREIRETLKELATSGVTVFITTHNMEEADTLCQRVAFIKKGKLVAMDSPQNLKIQHGQRSLLITLLNGDKRMIPLFNENDVQEAIRAFGSGEIQTIHSQEASLEDVFVRLAGNEEAK
ncbi:MAG: ABC transporter ATP-binding protein [Chloroflexi bacterium]|nr:ABC transporter ATP-binding protein [Chloroflexota bacterium]